MVKKMVKGVYNFVMVRAMKASSKIIVYMVTAFTYDKMGKNIKDIGQIIRCMEWEKLNGQMEENILVSILKIRNKAKELLNGKMEKSMWVSGKVVNNMEKVYL